MNRLDDTEPASKDVVAAAPGPGAALNYEQAAVLNAASGPWAAGYDEDDGYYQAGDRGDRR